MYEEIREDRQSTSPPVEVSTVYTYAKYTKPDGVETTEEYSLVTAPTSQKKVSQKSGRVLGFSKHLQAAADRY